MIFCVVFFMLFVEMIGRFELVSIFLLRFLFVFFMCMMSGMFRFMVFELVIMFFVIML